jgi:hypothetical protein
VYFVQFERRSYRDKVVGDNCAFLQVLYFKAVTYNSGILPLAKTRSPFDL